MLFVACRSVMLRAVFGTVLHVVLVPFACCFGAVLHAVLVPFACCFGAVCTLFWCSFACCFGLELQVTLTSKLPQLIAYASSTNISCFVVMLSDVFASKL